MRAFVVAMMIVALSVGCGDKKKAGNDKPTESGAAEPAKAPAKKPEAREMKMAREVVAAIAAGDYSKLEAMMSATGRAELGDINERMFRNLRKKLEEAGVDLAVATIERVEAAGDNIETVDVFLKHEGRTLNFHFNVMKLGGTYDYVGHSEWFKWVGEDAGPTP